MRQLALDLTGNQDAILDLSGRRRVELRTRVRADEVMIELEAGSGRSARVRWSFSPDLHVVVEGHLRARWWMVDAATWTLGRRTSDVLDSLTDWVWREANGRQAGERESADREDARRGHGTLHAQLRAVQRAVLARCVPFALEAAARFRPSQRFEIYRWFSADASGRLAQLATTMPGLVLWTLTMDVLGLTSLVAGAARRLIAGARPRVVLAELLEAYRDAREPNLEDKALVFRRTLIEHASPWVEPMDLLMPPFAPVLEDIPRQRIAAVRWYRVLRRVLGGAADATSEIAPFVARHALVLEQAEATSPHRRRTGTGEADPLVQLGVNLARLARLNGRPLLRTYGVSTTLEKASPR